MILVMKLGKIKETLEFFDSVDGGTLQTRLPGVSPWFDMFLRVAAFLEEAYQN